MKFPEAARRTWNRVRNARTAFDPSRLPTDRVFIVPTLFGFLYGGVVLVLLLASFVWQDDDLFLVGALLSTFGLISMQQTHFNLASLKIEGCEPNSGFAGESVHWRVELSSKSEAFSVRLFETHVDVPASGGGRSIPVALGARGRYRLRRLRVASTYPLGLFYAWKFCVVDAHFCVYPVPASVENRAQVRVESREAPQDFAGHRDFRDGDSPRRIDWKAAARRDEWLVKLFEAPQPETVWILWSDLPEAPLEEKLSRLSGAVEECVRRGVRFGLELPDERFEPEAGPLHARRCLSALAGFGGEHEVA